MLTVQCDHTVKKCKHRVTRATHKPSGHQKKYKQSVWKKCWLMISRHANTIDRPK